MSERRERIAKRVVDAVLALDYGDLNGRAGRRVTGYVEPTEAAWQLLEESVAPLMFECKSALQRGKVEEARTLVEGILIGLYRLTEVEGSDLLPWAPDFPEEQAGAVLGEWAERSSIPAIGAEFIEAHIPQWTWAK